MVEKPVVTVDSNGIVRSNDVTGQAVITVSVLEDFGVSLSISVTIDVSCNLKQSLFTIAIAVN